MTRTSKRRASRNAAVLLCILASTGVHAAEHGAVTKIAAVNSQSAAFVGFASGAVLFCSRLSGCTELDGTPSSPVTSLDALGEGGNIKAWVGYENGTLYYCTLTGGCELQELTPNSGKGKRPL
jgi:hypothetical protein